jgi:hypothetical protein
MAIIALWRVIASSLVGKRSQKLYRFLERGFSDVETLIKINLRPDRITGSGSIMFESLIPLPRCGSFFLQRIRRFRAQHPKRRYRRACGA